MKLYLIILISIIFLFSCQNAKNQEQNPEIIKSHLDTIETVPEIKKPQYPDYVNIDFIMGKFNPDTMSRFKIIPSKYTKKEKIYLDTQTYNAFVRMYDDAYEDGFDLEIISALRNFDYQKRVWDWKWSKEPDSLSDLQKTKHILLYSSMPGSSRHHWGTEIDLNVLENSYFENGEGKKILDWMEENAGKYGFCRPYTAGRSSGYNEEKWHWSYLPLSKIYTQFAVENMKDEYIKGFKGAKYAPDLKITGNYILGINQKCLD